MLTGVPSIFVRTSGCNLRCWYCDTPYTSWQPEGQSQSLDQICEQIKDIDCQHIVITGGEPMLANEIITLCERLHTQKYHITIETAATVFKPVICDLISLSPKLASSAPVEQEQGRYLQQHNRQRLNIPVIQAFIEHCPEYQLKFVVDVEEDFEEIDDILNKLTGVEPSRVLLMPQGRTTEEVQERALWIVEHCKENGHRYCPRVHIELFGNQRGT